MIDARKYLTKMRYDFNDEGKLDNHEAEIRNDIYIRWFENKVSEMIHEASRSYTDEM